MTMRHIAYYPGQHTHPLLAKTATGEMSEADLTLDGEWGFWVQVAEALGGTVHPFDVYQGPYIRYNGQKFWLQGDQSGNYIYNETTEQVRSVSMFFSDFAPDKRDISYIAEEIRDMARTSSKQSRKTALDFDFGDLTTIDPDTLASGGAATQSILATTSLNLSKSSLPTQFRLRRPFRIRSRRLLR